MKITKKVYESKPYCYDPYYKYTLECETDLTNDNGEPVNFTATVRDEGDGATLVTIIASGIFDFEFRARDCGMDDPKNKHKKIDEEIVIRKIFEAFEEMNKSKYTDTNS